MHLILTETTCPVCGSLGIRDPSLRVIDTTCVACGWHYTSAWARAELDAEYMLWTSASAAARSAAAHADEIAKGEGWLLGEGMWTDEASDHLFEQRTELSREVYELARELLNDERWKRAWGLGQH